MHLMSGGIVVADLATTAALNMVAITIRNRRQELSRTHE